MTGRYFSKSSSQTKPHPIDNRHTNTRTSPIPKTPPSIFYCTSMPMKSICAYSILFLIILLNCKIVEGKQNEGYDLDSDAPIRIGVKNRIKAKDCK